MFVKTRGALVILAGLLAPAVGFGQHTEADDVEKISAPSVKPSPDEKKPDLPAVAKRIVDGTNAFRKEQERGPVAVDDKLAEAAQEFAHYMARTDRFGHTADGSRPADRAKKHGYDYCIVLENIAYQYNSRGFTTQELSDGFLEGWKHSPGHRRNMLDPDVTQTGVAVARSEATAYYYAVQMFGRPKSEAIEFTLANESGAEVKYEVGEQAFSLGPNFIRTHTRCRPAAVKVHLSGGGEEGRTETLKPNRGDQFVIREEGGRVQVSRK
jgi:uncharacterized protein YkwD